MLKIKVIEADTDSKAFAEELKAAGEKAVLVDFYATWCGPCKMIAPKLEEWSKEFTNVVFLKVDVDDCEDLAMEYEVTAMPTFILFKNGAEADRTVGANPEQLKEMIKKHK